MGWNSVVSVYQTSGLIKFLGSLTLLLQGFIHGLRLKLVGSLLLPVVFAILEEYLRISEAIRSYLRLSEMSNKSVY